MIEFTSRYGGRVPTQRMETSTMKPINPQALSGLPDYAVVIDKLRYACEEWTVTLSKGVYGGDVSVAGKDVDLDAACGKAVAALHAKLRSMMQNVRSELEAVDLFVVSQGGTP